MSEIVKFLKEVKAIEGSVEVLQNLQPGDTVILRLDFDKVGFEMAKAYYVKFEKIFQENNLILIPKGLEISKGEPEK